MCSLDKSRDLAGKLEFLPFWQDLLCGKVFSSEKVDVGPTTFLITEHTKSHEKVDFPLLSMQVNGAFGDKQHQRPYQTGARKESIRLIMFISHLIDVRFNM